MERRINRNTNLRIFNKNKKINNNNYTNELKNYKEKLVLLKPKTKPIHTYFT